MTFGHPQLAKTGVQQVRPLRSFLRRLQLTTKIAIRSCGFVLFEQLRNRIVFDFC